jgi:hypothetical protein
MFFSIRTSLHKRASQIVPMSWVELPADSYTILSESRKQSYCQLEVTIRRVSLSPGRPRAFVTLAFTATRTWWHMYVIQNGLKSPPCES